MSRRRFSAKEALFAAIAFSGSLILVSAIVWIALPLLKTNLRPQLAQIVALSLSEDELLELASEAVSDVGSYWDAIPEPAVNRIAQRGYSGNHKSAEIRINNAGMRASRDYEQKPKDTYRIVCLGDSFVFGTAGPEEDRFCDQIEAYYSLQGITAGERRIETLALGLEGWTARQEATYLTSRLSSYDPDLILTLAVANDLTDSSGVSGLGAMTTSFSPEFRHHGSGVYVNQIGHRFGYRPRTSLGVIGLSREGDRRWAKAMSALKRLVDLQSSRGGRTLLAVMDWSGNRRDAFAEAYVGSLREHGIASPYIITSFFPDGQGTRLPHDGHPSRLGHQIMANHYISVLDRLSWIPLPDATGLDVDGRLSTEISPEPRAQVLEAQSRQIMKRLKSEIDFLDLGGDGIWALLGGVFPEQRGRRSNETPPWGSVSSGFLMRSLGAGEAQTLSVAIAVPEREELFPFSVDLYINGQHALTHRMDHPSDAVQLLEAEFSQSTDVSDVVEVRLETASYFCEIDDHRMKSYQLLSAKVESR
jgi:lysophospholipase L1-like esterase